MGKRYEAEADWEKAPVTDKQIVCIETLSSKLGHWLWPTEIKTYVKNRGEASRAIDLMKRIQPTNKKMTDEEFEKIFITKEN